jgi:hypothetical protein
MKTYRVRWNRKDDDGAALEPVDLDVYAESKAEARDAAVVEALRLTRGRSDAAACWPPKPCQMEVRS